jgi:hypothetical protein
MRAQAWFENVSVAVAPSPPPTCPPAPPPMGPNLVQNPNFDVVAGAAVCGWGGIDGVTYRRSTTVAAPGTGANTSLAFHGTDPNVYSSVSQHMPNLLAGVSYTMHASVRTRNLSGSGGYASITGSWTNGKAESKRYGGTYPPGPGGTTQGWVTVGGGFTMSADATPGSFVLHAYAQPFLSGDATPTGWAWFGNVSVVHQPPRPLRTTLVSPVYRGRTASCGPAVVLVAHFAFDVATTVPARLAVQLQLQSRQPAAGGSTAVLWRGQVGVVNVSAALELNVTAMMPANGQALPPPGEYTLLVSCLNVSSSPLLSTSTGSQVMVTDNHNLTVLTAATKPPRVAIDEQLRIVLDGKQPFFPVGFVGFCTTLANASQMAVF